MEIEINSSSSVQIRRFLFKLIFFKISMSFVVCCSALLGVSLYLLEKHEQSGQLTQQLAHFHVSTLKIE